MDAREMRQALLASGPQGVTNYIDAGLRDTGKILAQATGTMDFSRPHRGNPVAILQRIDNAHDPYRIVAKLQDAVPAGLDRSRSHPASGI